MHRKSLKVKSKPIFKKPKTHAFEERKFGKLPANSLQSDPVNQD